MRSDIQHLLELQSIDQKLLAALEDLQRIPHQKEQQAQQLHTQEQHATHAQKEKKDQELKINQLNLELETRKNTLSRLRTQQFETKKNDEYQMLGEEIIRYEQEVDLLETTLLEQMEVLDGSLTTVAHAQTEYDKAKQLIQKKLDEIEQKEHQLNTDIETIRRQSEAQKGPLDEDLLDLYERLMANKKGIALVAITPEGQCSGCHIKLTPANVIAVHAETELIQCENCGRLLY